jgi:IS605 OrfB family transposase
VIVTYKYALKGQRTRRKLRRFAWAVNQAWNFCVETQRATEKRRKEGTSGPWLSGFDLDGLAVGTSKDLGIIASTVTQVCRQFARSRDEHRRCPKFRSSGGPRRALGWVPFRAVGRALEGNTITYVGNAFRWFGAKCRPLPAIVKGGAFVEDASGRWWVCLQVEVSDERATGAGEIGIDLGLKHLAVTSEGEKVEAIQSYRHLEAKLATAQCAGNRSRARAIHRKIRNIRADHLHKTSARLAAANRLIVVGDVSPSRLARTRHAKSVLDAGWSTFRNQLRYKASRHGAEYLEVSERFTTQTCSSCGALPPERPRGIAGLGIREWRCSSCGATHDRDVNAAKNILAIGRSAAPRGDGSRAAHGRQPDRRDNERRGDMLLTKARP